MTGERRQKTQMWQSTAVAMRTSRTGTDIGCLGVFPSQTPLIALPNWRVPRVLLPVSGGAARRWRASAFYPATRSTARAYRLAMRAKAALGLGEVRRVVEANWDLEEFLKDCISGVTSVVVQTRPAGPSQKFTFELRDRRGTVIAYLKYGSEPLAQQRLAHEHAILSSMPVGLAPAVLKFAKMGNGTALLVTPLHGRPMPARLPPPSSVVEFVLSNAGCATAAASDHPLLLVMRRSAGEALDPILEDFFDRPWPVGLQHGDFVPWNLRCGRDGRLSAFDWEYGTLAGLPYLDLAYFTLQVANHLYAWPAVKSAVYTAQWLVAQPALRLSSNDARAVIRLAMFEAHRRALQEGYSNEHPLQNWRRRIWRGLW